MDVEIKEVDEIHGQAAMDFRRGLSRDQECGCHGPEPGGPNEIHEEIHSCTMLKLAFFPHYISESAY